MNPTDSYEISEGGGDSFILSESPPSGAFSSATLTRSDDLSLSELSIVPQPSAARPFSLLARPPQQDPATPVRDPAIDANVEEGTSRANVSYAEGETEHVVTQTREEKLRSDLFTLRKLNSVFAVYNEALAATESGTEVRRIGVPYDQCDSYFCRA